MKKVLNNNDVEWWGYSRYDGSDYYLGMRPSQDTFFLLNNYFPEGVTGNDIKAVDVSNGQSVLFITNSGKIFGSGYNASLGINETSGTSNAFVDITVKDASNNNVKISSFFNPSINELTQSIIVDENNNMYMTNLNTVLFRDNILQQSWTLLAQNVKKFNATSDSNCIAYIDNNDDLWVAGEDTWVLGMNTATAQIQPNFVRLKDKLQGLPIYNNIDGKVVDYCFAIKKLYILTNEEDNNTLYVSGHFLSYSWTRLSYIGNGVDENCIIPTKLFDNCEQIVAANLENLAVRHTEEGYELWLWGRRDGNAIPAYSEVPIKWSRSDATVKDADSLKIWSISYDKSYIGYEKDNVYHLMVCGREGYAGPTGVGATVGNFTELSYNDTSTVKNFVCGSRATSYMFSTASNKYYGFGLKKLMGKGITNNDKENSIVGIDLGLDSSTVIGIAGGNGWYIVTTSDGKVYGTGSNTYGILGRWAGVGRGESNSRYKTAFNWVECPELEI